MAYQFGDFVLDPKAYELRREREKVHLEPRVLELLVMLVESRHRVVTKEQLLATVWDGQFVGESALTRAVYEARRALGDDSKRQELIRTIHGRGYQFVAATEETFEGPETAVAPAEPRSSSRAEPSPPRRGGPSRSVVALVLATLVALVVVSLTARRSQTVSDPLADSGSLENHSDVPRVALLPFGLATSDAEIELTALSLTDLLWGRLGSQPGLIVRTPRYGREVGESVSSIAALAEEARVDAVLSGSLTPVPGTERLEIRVELYEVDAAGGVTSLPIGRYELPRLAPTADLDVFVRVREAIADDVVEHLAPALATPPSDALSPHDPEAFRLYLLARERFATITCGDADALLDLLDRSLEIDPDFALAWVAKGFALYSQVWSCGRDASFAERALAATERALDLEGDLPLAIYLESILLVESGRAEDAFARLRTSRRRHPHSPMLSFAESYVLRYAGFLQQAEERLEETIELDPLFLREYGASPLPLLYRGELARFLELQPATDTPHDRFYRGLVHVVRGDRGLARGALEPAFRLNPTDVFGRFSAALLAVLDGERATGARIVSEVARQRDRLATPDGEMTFKEAQLLAFAGEPRAALARLQKAVRQGFFCAACIRQDPFLASLRAHPDVQRLVAEAERRHLAFAARFGLVASERPGP